MKVLRTHSIMLLSAALFLAGCADLTNIKKFASASADSANFTSLVTDYEKSAERQQGYEPAKKGTELDQTIADRKAQQKPLLGLLQGIQGYMNALGALASDQLVSYDTNLTSVSDGLKATKAVSTNQANAFDALSKLIAKAATDGYRQAKLKALIADANPHLQIVIEAMTNIVGNDFVAALKTEAESANMYFEKVIITASNAPPQTAAIELVKEAHESRINELNTKRQACLLYAKTLETIAKGHQTLYDNTNALSSAELLGAIDSYGTSISQLVTQLKQLK